ncbi:hypothetical protein [Deinococcus cellulosilyticus]|uniref:Uncharacterized protein n=1 Tax=Deinococcus cellulosilyticus (strain DSM 18568 / NBRC 106333 / KACC 11606 / 5516J-15) TaxID=1223518 RepID=A0A511NA04_DEIC1|nr:hypothetical protein [Deinococcus cellulosilyticus]GEM49655.1 hypothetical protein DC3_52900 [Deinococcus cellulosilyticus NBRC 106333 = KACC 11606]
MNSTRTFELCVYEIKDKAGIVLGTAHARTLKHAQQLAKKDPEMKPRVHEVVRVGPSDEPTYTVKKDPVQFPPVYPQGPRTLEKRPWNCPQDLTEIIQALKPGQYYTFVVSGQFWALTHTGRLSRVFRNGHGEPQLLVFLEGRQQALHLSSPFAVYEGWVQLKSETFERIKGKGGGYRSKYPAWDLGYFLDGIHSIDTLPLFLVPGSDVLMAS